MATIDDLQPTLLTMPKLEALGLIISIRESRHKAKREPSVRVKKMKAQTRTLTEQVKSLTREDKELLLSMLEATDGGSSGAQ